MNVGIRAVTASDDVQGVRVPLHVWYPTEATPRREMVSVYSFEAARDAPISGERLPVVAISHGTGGTPWGYTALATYLARAGFAVVSIEHPGNSRTDNSLADTAANLANRPRHVRVALDAVFAELGTHVGTDAAVIGHSMGGYTALAVVGGRPMALPNQHPDGVARPVAVEPDPRVRAVVLLAPALPWFMAPGALAEVRVPVLARAGERDDVSPPFFIQRILHGLPRLDHAVVPGAGHFFCFGPVPPAMAGMLPAQDPPGFDRAAYQVQLFAEIAAFLRA
jgi:predicted dienelactone hydrolase